MRIVVVIGEGLILRPRHMCKTRPPSAHRTAHSRRGLAFIRVLAMLALVSPGASAAVVETRVHGDGGDDFIVSCDAGPIAADYVAETASGASRDSSYAAARGADKGLVRLMSRGGTPAKRYIVPHRNIRAVVKVTVDSVIPDRADLVFTAPHLILIHTATADAGVFTGSDVYELPYRADGRVDTAAVQSNPDLLQMLSLGLSAYRPRDNTCVR